MTTAPTPLERLDDDEFGAELERIVTSADTLPRADLAGRALERIAAEPRTSAPRRFLAALAALDLSASFRGFGQTVATATGGSRIPAIVRFQAVGVLGAAATISIAEIVTSPQRASKQQPPPKRATGEGVVHPAAAAPQYSDDGPGPRSERASDVSTGSDKAKVKAKSASAKDKDKGKAALPKKAAATSLQWAGEPGNGKAAKKPDKASSSAAPAPSPGDKDKAEDPGKAKGKTK